MTTPYSSLPPTGPHGLAAFYPEWARPVSGYEAERHLLDEHIAARARTRRRRRHARALWRARRLWRMAIGVLQGGGSDARRLVQSGIHRR